MKKISKNYLIDCLSCGQKNSSKFQFSNSSEKNSRFDQIPRDVFLCKNCGIIFLKQTKNLKKKIIKYYSQSNHFLKPGLISEGQKKRRINQVNWVLSNINSSNKISSVADFGSGSGYFLKVFKDNGYKELLGLDFSEKMCEIAKKNYKINFLSGDFLKRKIKKKFDLITCIQTLEHLLNPSLFAVKAKKTLSKNGYLFIEVPDSEHPNHELLPDFYAFDHLFHFTEKSLSNLLETHGFEIVAIAHIENEQDSGNPFTVLRVLAQKKENFEKRYNIDINYSKYIEKILSNYKKKHNFFLNFLKRKISKIHKKINKEKFAIYCGGEHTNLLIKYFSKYFKNALVIYDGDKYIEGNKINNIPILHSSKIKKNNKIKNYLISSTNHELEIYNTLKKINPIFKIYRIYNDN